MSGGSEGDPPHHSSPDCRCDELGSCELAAQLELEQDPCPATEKYLEAHYICHSLSDGPPTQGWSQLFLSHHTAQPSHTTHQTDKPCRPNTSEPDGCVKCGLLALLFIHLIIKHNFWTFGAKTSFHFHICDICWYSRRQIYSFPRPPDFIRFSVRVARLKFRVKTENLLV